MDNDDPNQERRSLPQESRPASPEEVEDAIGLILEGFGGRSTNADKFKAYAIALEGIPVANIARGVKAILRGEVAGIDPAFPPTAAQLAKACRPVTFLSPGWIALEQATRPQQIEKPKSRVDAVITAAINGMKRHERDE